MASSGAHTLLPSAITCSSVKNGATRLSARLAKAYRPYKMPVRYSVGNSSRPNGTKVPLPEGDIHGAKVPLSEVVHGAKMPLLAGDVHGGDANGMSGFMMVLQPPLPTQYTCTYNPLAHLTFTCPYPITHMRAHTTHTIPPPRGGAKGGGRREEGRGLRRLALTAPHIHMLSHASLVRTCVWPRINCLDTSVHN